MADSRRYALNAQLDIEQILLEAQHRWLRPAEICEILQNHKKFRIAPEPPNRPTSGSLFLFDRKVLRYFRKDGHNWRKKKDGKTVKEAHERLKAGSIDVLHCYYAHGEDNENFQRRSYWMLEEELSHIVLVHYRQVPGNRTNFNRITEAEVIPNLQKTEQDLTSSEVESSVSPNFRPYDHQVTSQVTDTTSLSSAQASEHEDAESAYHHQGSPGFQPFQEMQHPLIWKTGDNSVPYRPLSVSNDYRGQLSAVHGSNFEAITECEKAGKLMDNGLRYELGRNVDTPSWDNVLESNTTGYQVMNFQQLFSLTQPNTMSTVLKQGNELGQVLSGPYCEKPAFRSHPNDLEEWQTSQHDTVHISRWPSDQRSHNDFKSDLSTKMNVADHVELRDSMGHRDVYLPEQSNVIHNELQMKALKSRMGTTMKPGSSGDLHAEEKVNHPAVRQPHLDGIRNGGLKKLDSFDRWMSKELGDVTEPHMQPGSGAYWEDVGEDGVDDSDISIQVPLDNYILSPSLSQDQLFSIIDFSPNWAYVGSEIKVLVMGKFLRSGEELERYKFSCMFGEVEVPAEIIADGILRCHTPLKKTGRVPFYVTCSNRLACSEVREFDFRPTAVQDEDVADVGSVSSDETLLHMRFGKLLSLGSLTHQTSVQSSNAELSNLCRKISALLKDDTEWGQMVNLTTQNEFSADQVKDQLLQKLLKEKLHDWLLQKVTEGGKGPSVLDEDGLGVLHFAAALGYNWAIQPTIAAGVSVNFRDANGLTALHWAAYYGRERTVAFLMSIGAAAGALTDPTPKYPSGRTPADLASSKGHKGIAGYLAECSLSSHLSAIELKDSKEGGNGAKAVEATSDRTATPFGAGDWPHGLSMKDSLAAVRNATQAAARIHQVFRIQSFQRKQIKDYDSEFGMSDERVISFLAAKNSKAGMHDEPLQAAAIRIQNKFRSWKGRKEFLLIRQRVIKIQAHVRGHQVRKNYKKIIWSVGILDKVILRWRRKGKGLKGFKPEALTASTSLQEQQSTEDDYNFLKEGRKQSEQRMQKALARVKSMVQYPEARDQYRRLLNVVSEMQETKAKYDNILNNQEGHFDDDLFDLDALLEEDTLMTTVS